jgi:hypothetical protein
MTQRAAGDVFARREDADWAMFCRGGQDAEPFAADAEPVELEPGEDAGDAGYSLRGVRHFIAPVVGLPYPNADGTSRREAVRELRTWEKVQLVHRPDNPVDANAVAVLCPADGRQLGYLPAATAAEVVAAARAGTRYLAVVNDVTGGDADDLVSVAPVRATLVVLVLERGATKAHARRHLLDLMNRRSPEG